MTENGGDFKPHDYWNKVGASRENVVQAIERIEGRDEWTVHAVVLSGESSTAFFACVVRSKVGDNGLLLSERMVRLPKDMETADELDMLDNRITRRVSGPLAQALAQGYARASNDRLAADDLEADPVALSAVGAELDKEPTTLLDPIGDDPHEAERERQREAHTVECTACGNPVEKSEATNIGGALGVEQYVHSGPCPDEDEDGGV